MNSARLIVLGVAIVAGGLAALLASNLGSAPPPPPVRVEKVETVGVLVAAKDIGIGHALSEGDLTWQHWPVSAAGDAFVRQSNQPDAVSKYAGSIARAPFSTGEPIRANKLIKAEGSGYMAAILPSGMRAVSTRISPETGAGGFILPNDRVDVILSQRDRAAEQATGIKSHISETILSDVRVLAIDQVVEEKDGQQVVVGRTATLGLTRRQAEILAQAHQEGSLSLALRSLADADPNRRASDDTDRFDKRIDMVRFGVTSTTAAK